MGLIIYPEVRDQILTRYEVSPSEFEVKAIPVKDRITKIAHFLLGKFSELIVSLFGKENLPRLAHFALEARYGVSLQVVKKGQAERWTERLLRYLPFAGVAVVGLAAGLALRSTPGSDVVIHSSKELCRKAFQSQPALAVINQMKQWEIKNFAYLTPFVIPCIMNVISHLKSQEKDIVDVIIGKLKTKVKKEINEKLHGEFSFRFIASTISALTSCAISMGHGLGTSLIACKEVLTRREAYLASLAVLGLGNSYYVKAAASLVPGFDLSGHCMIKTVCAALLCSEMKSLSERTSFAAKKMLALYATLYAATDAVLLYNTVTNCHTLAESLSGFALGATLVALSRLITQKIPLKIQALH